jgi:hypothetical protein
MISTAYGGSVNRKNTWDVSAVICMYVCMYVYVNSVWLKSVTHLCCVSSGVSM